MQSEVTRIARTHSALSDGRTVAFQVMDGGADKIFKPGWYVIARQGGSTNPLDYGNGDLLVIERRRGSLVNRSVRKVTYKTKTSCKLVCPSTSKKYQKESPSLSAEGR